MKKIFLFLALFLGSLIANAQSLLNTTWLGTNPPSPNLWFQFRTDTLFYSFGSGGYTALSLYTASSGQFAMFDLPGVSLCTDTGRYNYSITGNILTFTLIIDNCVSRRNTMLGYHWLLLSTGITDLSDPPQILVYPNPATDGILTLALPDYVPGSKSEVQLYDLNGKLVLLENIHADRKYIDISFLPPGLYTGFYVTDSKKIPLKVIR